MCELIDLTFENNDTTFKLDNFTLENIQVLKFNTYKIYRLLVLKYCYDISR